MVDLNEACDTVDLLLVEKACDAVDLVLVE